MCLESWRIHMAYHITFNLLVSTKFALDILLALMLSGALYRSMGLIAYYEGGLELLNMLR